jgi:diaminopimelate decarboxylase
MAGFSYRRHRLTVDDVALDDLAVTVRTPFYVYSALAIRERFAELEAGLAGTPHAIHYAL